MVPSEVFFALWGLSSLLLGSCAILVLATCWPANPRRYRADWYAGGMVLAALVMLLAAHPAAFRIMSPETPFFILPLALAIAILHRFDQTPVRVVFYLAFGLALLYSWSVAARFLFIAWFWAVFNFPPGSPWSGHIG